MLHYPSCTKPLHPKLLVCFLGLLVFVADMVVPADLNVAIFYCFVVVICAWTDSRVFLWAAAAVFSGLTIPGLLLSPPPFTGPVSWVDWANRLFGIGALLLVTVFTHFRMRNFVQMQKIIHAKDEAERELRDGQLRLKLAQAAGHVGSWEWDPGQNSYKWSEECYELFGIGHGDSEFIEHWMHNVHSADLHLLRSEMSSGLEEGEFELDYRYEHPVRGLRWIHIRAKVHEQGETGRRLFGIHQDVTERKQFEAFLQQSQSTLESLVEQRTAALRKLSVALLQSQDEERRRIARELHDSFGQSLVSLKINLDILAGVSSPVGRERRAEVLSECLTIVQQCIAETRTLSHLLHPALLDEAGFSAAARWYVEGFATRTNVLVRLELPPEPLNLPPAVEIVLFRALQECLTNVHRYSGSSSVDVALATDAEQAVLTIQDYGRGIPAETIQKFRNHGSGVGVGLSGMRERMTELGGTLEIFSDSHGTTIRAFVPLSDSDIEQDSSIQAA